MKNYEERKETLLLANADYEERLQHERLQSFNVRTVEREWKLPAGQLANFRKNKNRRKYSGVTYSHPSGPRPAGGVNKIVN